MLSVTGITSYNLLELLVIIYKLEKPVLYILFFIN